MWAEFGAPWVQLWCAVRVSDAGHRWSVRRAADGPTPPKPFGLGGLRPVVAKPVPPAYFNTIPSPVRNTNRRSPSSAPHEKISGLLGDQSFLHDLG